MTRVELLNALKSLCEKAVKDMPLPLQVQKGDKKQQYRNPNVYLMRLPNGQNADKYAPYIIVQLISDRQVQKEGELPRHTATIRFIFCVYCADEQDGAVLLLNVMDKVQQAILKKVQVGKSFLLNVLEPLESIVYPDDTAPFFAGEMVGEFILPAIEREVDFSNGFAKIKANIRAGSD